MGDPPHPECTCLVFNFDLPRSIFRFTAANSATITFNSSPEIAATAAVGQYPSAWRSSCSRYAASCQLTGIEKLALPFADCSGGIVSPAGRALLFYSRVQCASPQTLRAKVYAGRHDFGDYKKAISPGSERLTRPSSSESPTEMHQGCIGPYGLITSGVHPAPRWRQPVEVLASA